MIINVKYLTTIHPVEIDSNASVADLASQLQSSLSIQTTLSLFCDNQILARDRKLSTLDQSKQLLAITSSTTSTSNAISPTTSSPITIQPHTPTTTSTSNLMDQLLPSLIQSHPGISSLIEQHPELRQMMNDPQFIQQQMAAMSNPALRQEMERQQDLQLAQIEAHPGGMGHLENMYRTLNNAELDRSSVRVKTQTGPSIPSQVLNTTALPNPWAAAPTPTITTPTYSTTSTRSPLNDNNLMQSLLSQSNTSARQPTNLNSTTNPNHTQTPADLSQMMSQMNQLFPGASTGTNQAFNQLASQAMGGQVNQQGLDGLANVGQQPGTGRQQPDINQMVSQMNQMFPGASSGTNAEMNRIMGGMMGSANTGGNVNINGNQRQPDINQMMSQMNQMFPGASSGGNAQLNQMIAGMGQPRMSDLFGRIRGAPVVEGGLNVQAQQPEIRFAEQLSQLRDMGFIDSALNLRALTRAGGDLELAIAHILEN